MLHSKMLFASLLLMAPVAMGGAPSAHVTNRPRLEHIAVWTEDLERTSIFLTEALGWRRHPVVFGVDKDSTVFGGMNLAFIDANGFWIELVQPTTPGPGMDFLKAKGDGSIVELDFAIDEFDKNYDDMKARGIHLVGMDGSPLKNNGRLSDWIVKGGPRVHGDDNGGLLSEWVIKDGRREYGDERLAYLPMDVSRGTSIELFVELANGVVIHRDDTWGANMRTPANRPRLDHIVVAAEDLSKTTGVYTDVLQLERLSSTQGLRRDWMGVGDDGQAWIRTYGNVWLDLVAPSGPKGASLMKDPRYGDGALMELAVEVDNVDAFYDRMKAEGIDMTAGDATPLPAGQKAVTVAASGDRYSYFPLDKSFGMRIMVFQRGPKSTSALSRRDASAAR